MKDKLPVAGFVASIAILAAGYGMAAARYGWFPYPAVDTAIATANDLKSNWKNDAGLEPTRHLVPTRPRTDGAPYHVARPEAVTPGYTLVAGLSRDQDSAPFTVTMYDDRGDIAHVWPIDYAAADPEGPNPLNTMIHGMEVLPDGSLIATFDAGNAIARFDACGGLLWSTLGGFHHTITLDSEPGGVLTWRGDVAVRVDIETGEVTDLLDIRTDMMDAGAGQEGILGIRTFLEPSKPLTYDTDPFHANDVEALRPEMADAFPGFEAGDLMISLRELNLVAVADRDTGEFKWFQHGPWLKQHDPDFQPDGTITVFDNHSGSGQSRILRIDPETRQTEVLFEGSDALPFYTWQRGKHQVLPSGNILITEAEHGRILEVTPAGDLVWERNMDWDDTQNLIVTEARHVGPAFFAPGAPGCDVTAALGVPKPRG